MMQLGYLMANNLTLDDVEERSAIVADGCGVSRAKSEALTAAQYGCKTWDELIRRLHEANDTQRT